VTIVQKLARVACRGLTAIACLSVALIACGDDDGDGDGDTGGIVGYTEVNGYPAIELEGGKIVLLQRFDETQAILEQFRPPDEEAPPDPPTSLLLPARVDLRINQHAGLRSFDTIEDQGGRNTCIAHATVAALEAAYQRERGLSLDLSEQYANHIQKMTALPREPLTIFQRETQLGTWGGSGISYQLAFLFRLRFGLPEEDDMRGIVESDPSMTYIPWGTYENTNEDGDNPRLRWSDPSFSQDQIDFWNLNPDPTDYDIPDRVRLTNLPRAALANAVYGASRVRSVPLTLDGIRTELAAGREVAFGVKITRPAEGSDEVAFADGIWLALTEEYGAHGMLIVGYDDERETFLVKNSWGRDSEGRGWPTGADLDADGFIEMSYDWVPHIYEAFSVLETRDPATWLNQQALIGRWKADLDTFVGHADLAAYHIPGAFPSESLSGARDFRIGTLYSNDAGAFRVNGYFGDRTMRAWFGTNAINDSYDLISGGQEIHAYVYSQDPTTMAGWVTDHTAGDRESPFFATTDTVYSSRAARADATTTEAVDYTGAWVLYDDGDGLNVALTKVVGQTVTGLYRDDSGAWRPGVVATLSDSNPCRVELRVPWPDGTRIYDGRFYCDADSPRLRGMIAGIRGSGASARGFHAIRSSRQGIIITSPTEGSSFPRGSIRVDFAAEASDVASVQWTSSIDGVLSNNLTFGRLNLSFGEHVISARAIHTDGSDSEESVRITITNDPPTVNIIEPDAGDGPFCVGEAVTFRAAVTDINEPPSYTLPNSAVAWRTGGGTSLGTGKLINHTFSAPGTTNVIVRATDSLGLYDEDNVSVTAEDCPDSPPTVAITVPAADTGTSDTAYAYDGYDNGVGMWYTDVPVTGSATDPEDGTLTGASLVWTTDRTDLQAGGLGTGVSRTARLYSNVCTGVWHEVTLTATDSNGNSRSAVRRIFIWTLCRRKQP